MAIAAAAAVAVSVAACSEDPRPAEPQPLAQAAAAITAVVETEPVPHADDAADDPAIWVDEDDPGRSTVIGTDKEGGLAVYDLGGRELQYLPDGPLNNVDLRSGFRLGGEEVTLVTAGNRADDTLAVYRVDPASRRLEDVAPEGVEVGITPYGSCMYRSAETGRAYAFVNSEDGEVEQWELRATPAGTVDARRVRELSVASQTEGCVADDERGRFYLGEEAEGIWRFGAEPSDGTEGELVDTTGTDGHLTADVEGLAIAAGRDGDGYLVASSQGSGSYVLYERGGDNAFVGEFSIGAGGGIDGTSDTDGLEVTTAALGRRFPDGLLVVQDGDNDGENQNFKLVDWADVVGPKGPTEAVSTGGLAAPAPVTRDEERSTRRASGSTAPASDLGVAVAAALAEVPGVVVEAELDEEDDALAWDVEVVQEDGTRIELTIDAGDGAVLRTEADDDGVPAGIDGTPFSTAVAAALESVPGQVVEAELDDDRPMTWNVEIVGDGGGATEVLVDVADGRVLGTAPED
jgi:3-phytase